MGIAIDGEVIAPILPSAGPVLERSDSPEGPWAVGASEYDEIVSPPSDDQSDGNDSVGPVRPEMTGAEMLAHLTEVGERLAARGITGEIVLAGGAVIVESLFQ